MANLDSSWEDRLKGLFASKQMQNLRYFLQTEKAKKKVIFPPNNLTFNALNLTPFDKVKVIIIGQDPYHGDGQAHGLCFSVPDGIRAPPSLKNVFTELKNDLGVERTMTDLSDWAQQGVLLLNSVLTVEKQNAGSHADKGWEIFTDAVIKTIAQEKNNCAFILWGAYAHKKAGMINPRNHLLLQAAHPSPFSADKGFFGSRPFSATNAFLTATNQQPINWTA